MRAFLIGAGPVGRFHASNAEIILRNAASSDPISSLIVATKAHQSAAALAAVAHRLTNPSTILLLMNGNLAALQAIQNTLQERNPNLSVAYILGTTSYGLARHPSDQHKVVVNGIGQTTIGHAHSSLLLKKPSDSALQLAEEFMQLRFKSWKESINVSIADPDKLLEQIWLKLAINACLNPVSALVNRTNGAVLDPDGLDIISNLAHELAPLIFPRIPNSNIRSTDELVQTILKVAKATANNTNSMLADIQLNKQTEIDFITGFLVQTAKQQGIHMPLHSLLMNLIRLKSNPLT